ncbi:MAG: phosphatidylinositol mannoside acyltransferase [Actinomycetota bacterium]|nr:phosphatidylinositol mannoside acyltransferase [Actinomycetota bacterium]
MSNAAVDAAYGLGWALTRRLPEPVAQAAFARVGDQIWRRGGRGVQRLRANLRRARPEAGDAELDTLTRAAVRSYLRYWCEAFRLPVWSRAQVLERIVVHDEHLLRDAYAEGRGVVVPLPHLANWDLAGAWACLTGMPLTTVAERLEPERLFQRFVAYRERLGMEVLPLTGGEASPLRTLCDRARGGRLICLVADRDLTATGLQVRLLGAPARLPGGPAMVARTTGAALVPATLAYEGPRLHITIHPPVEHVAGREGIRAMTQRVADAFTRGIRAHPQDWHMLQTVFVDDLDPR